MNTDRAQRQKFLVECVLFAPYHGHMPLRDHFRPPLSNFASWEELHGGWPMVMVQHIGKILPSRYVAGPRVHRGSQVEVDVASFDREKPVPNLGNSAVAADRSTAWAPAEPTLAVETELPEPDEYEVRVYDAERGRRLVAAVELVSPSNKDRPENRAEFVAKCAALLRQQVSVTIVDLVTVRNSNLYSDLLEYIGEEDVTLGDDPPPTYAVSSRWHPRGAKRWLEAWNRPLRLGEKLPVLPLWLSEELALPLDLEASYEQTCRDLRIP